MAGVYPATPAAERAARPGRFLRRQGGGPRGAPSSHHAPWCSSTAGRGNLTGTLSTGDDVKLTVAMLDLDHFKRFNDEHGHQAGDRLLRSVTAAWSGKLRTVDQLARYGGEEFIVLLPGAGAELATTVLERLRSATPAGQTFSAGVATWDGTETSEELLARSDEALYRAKRTGRDRTVVAGAASATMAATT
jgi:diguanylate cyclase (GGDEF)-like protein